LELPADGRRAVLINVLQQPDGNAVAIADAVKQELAEVKMTLPICGPPSWTPPSPPT
jgi:multidrug efflux pump subunit AcrB